MLGIAEKRNGPGRNRAGAQRGLTVCILASVALACAAVLIVPLRAAFSGPGPFYRAGYAADEYYYMERIADPPAGASAINPYNGTGDRNVISPFFLETACRSARSLLGLDPVSFVWTWRLLYPLALWFALFFLARCCIGRPRRAWAPYLHAASASAAMVLLYCAYYFLVGKEIYVEGMFCFLNRVPTNVEVLLSVVILALFVRFLRVANLKNGLPLVLCGAVMGYLRPYHAVPWAITIGLGTAWLLFSQRLRVRDLAALCLAGALAATPYAAIAFHNSSSKAYHDLLVRFYRLPFPYQIAPYWPLFLAAGALLALASRWLHPPARIVAATGAATLIILPFAAGGIYPVARELLVPDRFASVYLVLVCAAGLLALGQSCSRWRGHGGGRTARKWMLGLSGLHLCAAALVIIVSINYDRFSYRPFPPAFVTSDMRAHAGYRWIKEHTPADALVLVDDGFDYGYYEDSYLPAANMNLMFCHWDFFWLLAQRRCVYSSFLFQCALTDQELNDLRELQQATLGMRLDAQRYETLLRRYPFDYIFWRKDPPVCYPEIPVKIPRGLGRKLKTFAEKAYSDAGCEIWDMHKLRAILSGGPAPAVEMK